MSERLPVEIVFLGEPFDREAVIHTLRHLAMYSGWTFSPRSDRRLIYATTNSPSKISATSQDLVVLSFPGVKEHLQRSKAPIPIDIDHPDRRPFPHPLGREFPRQGWINADVIAGAFALQNLWYESRTCTGNADGWITFAEDWWTKAGWQKPEPMTDAWLRQIQTEAEKLGWPIVRGQNLPGQWPFTVILTHDVDYLPTSTDRGMTRFIRSLARQTLTRRRLGDALLNLAAYAKAMSRDLPYDELRQIITAEMGRNVRSSFQFTVKRRHRLDPAYNLSRQERIHTLMHLLKKGFEICLHGSYRAGRTSGAIANEKLELERILGCEISGYRQHYLNFHPPAFFVEIENAGFAYDMSVGYNDMSGPRAGTYFPYHPFDMEKSKICAFWELPFVLMDTTLATTYRLSPQQALEHALEEIGRVETSRGCAAIIWHQEQLGGLLDPGYDKVYWDLLDILVKRGARLTSGNVILPELDALWGKTIIA